MSFRLPALAVSVFLFLSLAGAAAAQTADNVLVVANDASPASVQIAEYYAQKRGVAADHVVHIKTAPADAVLRAEYLGAIEVPIGNWLLKNSLQDKVLCIVLTKGVPLRVIGTAGRDGTVASVDSELTLLYRKLVGTAPVIGGRTDNPYFLAASPIGNAKRFTRFVADTYLVTRLDGFTVADIMKLVDRGVAPVNEGKFLLDKRSPATDRGGDDWLQEAVTRLQEAGAADRVVLENTRAVATMTGPVIGYFSWGSNDPENQLRDFGLNFVPGAIGGMFVSSDGRTFAEPPPDWKPSLAAGRGPLFGGGFQSLAGDLIRGGITGVSAHVAEPYLDATVRPQILFPAYVSGFNLAESFYLAMPFLSWQTIVVGDPLCTPFPRQTLTAGQIDKGLDPDTELPALFAERRLALLARASQNQAALKLLLKADVRRSQGKDADAEGLLKQAVQLDPTFAAANMRLAAIYEERRDYSKAVERYRAVVAAQPQNPAALNNLAYALAERMQNPAEGLPFAEKAYRLSPQPDVADTLGWIHHLMKDDRQAAPFVEQALAGAGDNPEILVHAATIHQALNETAKARQELDTAVKLDPQLAERADVKALQEKLK